MESVTKVLLIYGVCAVFCIGGLVAYDTFVKKSCSVVDVPTVTTSPCNVEMVANVADICAKSERGVQIQCDAVQCCAFEHGGYGSCTVARCALK